MRHSNPDTKRHYQLRLLEQVRQNLEKENENVYSKEKVWRFHDLWRSARCQERTRNDSI